MEKYRIFEFIDHVKQNKDDYINYCEIIIDPYGNIIKANPSHSEAVVSYAMEKENKTREQIKTEKPLWTEIDNPRTARNATLYFG